MDNVDWEAVEHLIRPLYTEEPLRNWDTACRILRHLDWIRKDYSEFDADRARLLCLFQGLGDRARDPERRRSWLRPLRNAGIGLEDQTWLWIALEGNGGAPAGPEEKAARDAWSLECVGAIGVARAFLEGGQTGRSVNETISALRKTLSEVEFLTPPARRLGVRRIVYTRRFLKELEEE